MRYARLEARTAQPDTPFDYRLEDYNAAVEAVNTCGVMTPSELVADAGRLLAMPEFYNICDFEVITRYPLEMDAPDVIAGIETNADTDRWFAAKWEEIKRCSALDAERKPLPNTAEAALLYLRSGGKATHRLKRIFAAQSPLR